MTIVKSFDTESCHNGNVLEIYGDKIWVKGTHGDNFPALSDWGDVCSVGPVLPMEMS